MTREAFIRQFNRWYKDRRPFVFLIDFEKTEFILMSPDEAAENDFLVDFDHSKKSPASPLSSPPEIIRRYPVSYDDFLQKFRKVQYHLFRGDTYLLNLTFKTPVEIKGSLKDIFHAARAPYKVYYKDRFVCFSPEAFITVDNGTIKTFPMKGTADASDPDARRKLLENPKEKYEHNTVVDLLRNDISYAAVDVEVSRYRYTDEILTPQGKLLQVSSEITGRIDERWYSNPAETLLKMLPAGSVSGAPKTKTLQIIRETEGEKRGFYTGITGKFDGQKLVTAVNIRYIERQNGKYYYRSGGGITAMSNPRNEYDEYLRKIYIPLG